MAHSNNNGESQKLKRTSNGNFASHDLLMEQWLDDESEHDFSDFDDEDDDPTFQPETEFLEADEVSDELEEPEHEEASPEAPVKLNVHQEKSYKGKKGFTWNREECPRTSRTANHNIIRLPGRLHTPSFEGYFELWSKLFYPSMLENLITFTNQKLNSFRTRFKQTTKVELKDTNVTEMKAFIGLLYYSSIFKCNDADLRLIFATDGTGHEVFRCVMSKWRFSCLINCLRFDDSTTRMERLKDDRLAPISGMFNRFISNSQSQYTPGAYLCIDEMLLPFTGRCKFIIYMPQKPAKFGIKIMLLVDARTYYVYNAYVYLGKNSDGIGLTEKERQMSIPT
ncbi:piggyBac transposable element-derived protein 4-like [Eupeodes corollae]|uniref:piggyBac transposable element-derived protein 4-like n=1 Tax=Eupeodes corollae TaxID=290404 RepID=UPI0024923642|nr:piggyBac transposable element-derived protein 4-like [Eupeodes corollae]